MNQRSIERIKFLKEPSSYFNEEEFVAHFPKVEGEDELFKKLGDQLQFPDYFGHNWNAVYDCLSDFHWILKKGVVLVHNTIPVLSDASLKIYLEVLVDATGNWKEVDSHYLKVVFPEDSRQLIGEMLA